MKRISIQGFYGMGNLGDEAILQSIAHKFRQNTSLEITVFSRNHEQVKKLHKIKTIPEKGKATFLKRLWEIKRSTVFCLGGGGLLKDYGDNSSSLAGWLHLTQIAMKLNVKTSLCAIGVDHILYNDSKLLLQEVLNKIDVLTVRDQESKNHLQQLGIKKEITVTSDPAILLTIPKRRKLSLEASGPRVMICLRHWFSKGNYIESPEKNIHFIKTVAQTADYLIEELSASIQFVPLRTTQYDDDRTVANQVIKIMRNPDKTTNVTSQPTVQEFLQLLNTTDLVLGMRLHALILAASSGIPIVGFAYMPKVEYFMSSLDQSKFCINMDEVDTMYFISKIIQSFDNHEKRSQNICNNIEMLQHNTHMGLEKIIDLAQQSN